MTDRAMTRRLFLGSAAAGLLTPVAVTRVVAQAVGADSAAAARAAQLRDPAAAGRARDRTSPMDNDEVVKSAELRLGCTCTCTLDIYTCRTTDFTCTYSPQLHQEIVALRAQGMDADQIIDAFVQKYGESALMAPRPQGFNLAGYLVPGAAIGVAGGILTWFLTRRQRLAAVGAGAGVADAPPSRSLGSAAGAGSSAAPAAGASPEELERLRRALDEVDA